MLYRPYYKLMSCQSQPKLSPPQPYNAREIRVDYYHRQKEVILIEHCYKWEAELYFEPSEFPWGNPEGFWLHYDDGAIHHQVDWEDFTALQALFYTHKNDKWYSLPTLVKRKVEGLLVETLGRHLGKQGNVWGLITLNEINNTESSSYESYQEYLYERMVYAKQEFLNKI
jgi:hypothetical protein